MTIAWHLYEKRGGMESRRRGPAGGEALIHRTAPAMTIAWHLYEKRDGIKQRCNPRSSIFEESRPEVRVWGGGGGAGGGNKCTEPGVI
jgi:hypothetical protein